jgi:4-amino-4-deoxy-L-arabinose transferase-like glycosyltransferase
MTSSDLTTHDTALTSRSPGDHSMTTLAPPPVTAPGDGEPAAPRGISRVWRGRPEDPSWARPGLFVLLAVTAALYLWNLSASGYANSFYSAAVQAGTQSWKAFFFGSSDASNFITVDKPPAALWIMEISARIFGVNSWSILVPEALMGVATAGILYATVKRWFGPAAGLIAGAAFTLTPVAALMFKFNNPDALLVLLLTLGAYCVTRAIEDGRTRWLIIAGALVGTGFITKMLQAFLVLPAFALVYLLAGPNSWGKRLWQLALSGVSLAVATLWWPVVVSLVPAGDRPFVGGSQDNSIWNLIFGYNGFGRLTGNETGSVGGGGGGTGTGMWGATGITRLFNSDFGGQISWLIPGALVLLIGGLVLGWRAQRTDRTRAGLLLWGGWLLVTGLTFSFASGIIHPYYTVALSPAIGALVGIGAVVLWRQRESWPARAIIAGALAATSVWAFILLDRSPSWHPWLRLVVLIGGLLVAAIFATLPRIAGRMGLGLAGLGLAAALAAPLGYTLNTVNTAHTGSIPSAGPAVSGGRGGFGGGGGRGGFGGGRGFGGAGQGTTGTAPGGQQGTGQQGTGQQGTGQQGTGQQGTGQQGTGQQGTNQQGIGGSPGGTGGFGGGGLGGQTGTAGRQATGGTRAGGTAGGAGGLLNASTSGKALTAALKANAAAYIWVAATTGSNNASGYQLASGKPVMAIGGFNGTDPAPTLAQFEKYVASKKIHYYISGSTMGAGSTSGSNSASQIASWVASHFTAKTIDGVTVYDLTVPTS